MTGNIDLERAINLLNHNRLDALHAYLTEALIVESVREKGGNTEAKRREAAKRYIKTALKSTPKEMFHGYWIDDKGHQCFTNMYSAYRFNPDNFIEGLPLAAEPENGKRPNIEDLIWDVWRQVDYYQSFPKVKQTELKAAIARWKADSRKESHCRFRLGIAAYDAQRLLEALEIFGIDEATVEQVSEYSPGLIKTDSGKALILPLRCDVGDTVYNLTDSDCKYKETNEAKSA